MNQDKSSFYLQLSINYSKIKICNFWISQNKNWEKRFSVCNFSINKWIINKTLLIWNYEICYFVTHNLMLIYYQIAELNPNKQNRID